MLLCFCCYSCNSMIVTLTVFLVQLGVRNFIILEANSDGPSSNLWKFRIHLC